MDKEREAFERWQAEAPEEIRHYLENEWLDDLQRCDGHAPCGQCERCTPGGQPWQQARAEWRAEGRRAA